MDSRQSYEESEQKLKQMELQLSEYQARERRENWMTTEFKNLAERLNEGIYRFDFKRRKFIFCNKTALKILGSPDASTRDLTPRSIIMRIHPDDRDLVRRAALESRKERKSGEVEYRYVQPDGAYRWIYDRWIVMRDSNGEPSYFEGIIIDNTKRKLAEMAIKDSRKKLRLLSSHLLLAQEKERRRISLELHDDLGQALTVLKLQLGSIKKKLPSDTASLKMDVENTLKYVDLIIENVRRLSHDLSPSILEDLGLDAALRLLIKEFVKHSDLQISCDIIPIDRLFSRENQIIIYRIFQETFTNIERHSKASRIWISIKQENDAITFTIKDDGIGFNVKQSLSKLGNERALGLTALDERTRMLGGHLHIDSIKGHGTQIVFNIPIDEAGEQNESLSNSVG